MLIHRSREFHGLLVKADSCSRTSERTFGRIEGTIDQAGYSSHAETLRRPTFARERRSILQNVELLVLVEECEAALAQSKWQSCWVPNSFASVSRSLPTVDSTFGATQCRLDRRVISCVISLRGRRPVTPNAEAEAAAGSRHAASCHRSSSETFCSSSAHSQYVAS